MSLAGKTIGRYRIIEQLGQGGMAVVYKAFDTRLQRDVALKLIRTENIPPVQLEQLQKRFEREALTQSRFHHPNIVPIHDFGEHQGSPYLVMTYLPGGTLQVLTGRPMPYPQAAGLLAPIADALAYAHKRDVLHRDVKPSNILLGEEGQPTLTDFGIAKLLGDVDGGTLTGTGMGIGTPQYMAPEQWRGKPEKATDIYALGVVFYELVTGRKPYDAETPAALAIIQATEPLPRPTEFISDLPEHVEQALYTALAPQPEDRYESMAAFEAVLKELSREEAQPAEAPLSQTIVEPLPEPLPEPEAVEAEEPELAEPEAAEPAEPVVPTFYPQDDKTEAEVSPPEPPLPAAQFGDEADIQSAPQQKFTLPVWGWGLIGLVVLAGIIFGITQLGGGGTEVAVATETFEILPTETSLPTNTSTPRPTATETAVPTPTIGIGSIMTNPIDGASMAYIPAGEFEMGSNVYDDEQPVHTVYTDVVWMYQYEVTNALYQNCVEAGICEAPGCDYYADDAYSDHPVVCVDWYEAKSYCEWAGGRLPTEAEWEKAARGGLVGMTYPWGDQDSTCTAGAENGAQYRACDEQTVPAGSFAPNGYGVYDMAGNVWEWVGDWYDSGYYDNSPVENPTGPASGAYRVLRGGSWYGYNSSLRAANRVYNYPDLTYFNFGFRCALSP